MCWWNTQNLFLEAFHSDIDEGSSDQSFETKSPFLDPKVFIDRGRQTPEGAPLLKERRYLRKDAAERLWKSLQTQGWKKTRPVWGATAEP